MATRIMASETSRRLVVARQPPPARHPAEGALDHPAPRQDLETVLVLSIVRTISTTKLRKAALRPGAAPRRRTPAVRPHHDRQFGCSSEPAYGRRLSRGASRRRRGDRAAHPSFVPDTHCISLRKPSLEAGARRQPSRHARPLLRVVTNRQQAHRHWLLLKPSSVSHVFFIGDDRNTLPFFIGDDRQHASEIAPGETTVRAGREQTRASGRRTSSPRSRLLFRFGHSPRPSHRLSGASLGRRQKPDRVRLSFFGEKFFRDGQQ